MKTTLSIIEPSMLLQHDNRKIITEVHYVYRDASNFKSHGKVAMLGSITVRQEEMIRSRCDSGEFFVAEQIGVPPLYGKLYEFSNGPTPDDHCFHQFMSFEIVELNASADIELWGTVDDFVDRVSAIVEWKLDLSPHYILSL